MLSLAFFLPLVMVSTFPFDIVINESLPIIGNDTWSAPIQLNNFTQPILGLPPAPPAFTTDIKVDYDKLVDPNSVYLVAVEAMYKFAQVAWQRKISTQIRVTQAYSDATIKVMNAGTLYQLENSHLILGLYRGVLSMLARSKWYETVIFLKVHGIIVGNISIAGPPQETALNGTAAIPLVEVAIARSLEGPFLRRG